jgi:uncharacterized OsmC-like protein
MAGIVNGVDTTALGKGIHEFRQDPELARFEFRARNRWLGDTRNMTTIGGFYGAGAEQGSPARPFMLRADEHQVLLGQDTGPNPVEHLLNALAACVTTAIVMHAAARGIHLEEVESELKGHLDVRGLLGITDEVRKGYQDIEFTFRVRGEGSEQQLRELAEFSPVFDVVRNGTRVNLVVEKMEPRQTDETPAEHPAPM